MKHKPQIPDVMEAIFDAAYLIFDLVVPREYSESQENALMMSILERLQEMDARYQCVITVEKSYVAEK